MHAWPRPDVPTLPASPGSVELYDSRTGHRTALAPSDGVARVYACGITPYDATHLGHAFTYLSVDLLNRALLDCGHRLSYVQNVTDVDDPLLERAEATGVDWRALAADQTDLFRADMTALRVLPPEPYRGVVESLPVILAALQRLAGSGRLYQVDDPAHPDWYFDVTGLDLGPFEPDEALALFAERGGDPDRAGKRHRMDCLVWRLARPGEPAWDSPLGPGRPGWHIECAAIAVDALGPAFDVQAGGNDLAFPHHPMCAAQASVLTGRPFAESYLHVGMVGLEGAKMSKSDGNLVFVSNLVVEGFDPMAIRLALLSHHYRADWDFTTADLTVAERRLTVWREAFTAPAGPPAASVVAAIRAAVRDDLDAPRAIAAVDEWAAQQVTEDPSAPGQVAAAVDALLGVQVNG